MAGRGSKRDNPGISKNETDHPKRTHFMAAGVQFIQKCPKVGQINPKKGNISWQQGYNSSKNGLRHGRRSHHPKRGCFKSGGPGFVQKGVVSRAEGIVSSENGML